MIKGLSRHHFLLISMPMNLPMMHASDRHQNPSLTFRPLGKANVMGTKAHLVAKADELIFLVFPITTCWAPPERNQGQQTMPPVLFDLCGKRVFVTGHKGMVGSAVVRRLMSEACHVLVADRKTVDLTQQASTERWLADNKPDVVINAAGRVGGIYANDRFPADFIVDNLAIGLNVIRDSFKAEVKKLVTLGSSCIYPRMAPQPMSEDTLLTEPLEHTNEWYAIAKIAAVTVRALRT